jgi:hypothetical protein
MSLLSARAEPVERFHRTLSLQAMCHPPCDESLRIKGRHDLTGRGRRAARSDTLCPNDTNPADGLIVGIAPAFREGSKSATNSCMSAGIQNGA